MTEEDLLDKLEEMQMQMEESIEHLQREMVKVRTGKASTSTFNGILVDYYGSPTPLNQVANVAVADAKTITIQPWEKTMLGPIEKAIFEANLGLTPMNDGELIRITIPPLTEERRRELGKKVKQLGEDAKVSIRNSRKMGMDAIKKAVKAGYPEDAGKRKEDEVQKSTDAFSSKINALVEAKDKEIMKV